jgi:hypothetical protein
MRRRKLVATAGAVTVTAFAATVAIGANFGLAGRAVPQSPAGRLETRTASAQAATSHVEPPRPTVPADD